MAFWNRAQNPELFKASLAGDTATVMALLNNGVDVDVKNAEGETALMAAALKGHKEIVELLILKGADVDIKASDGATAFMAATVGGHIRIKELLTLAGSGIEGLNSSDKCGIEQKKQMLTETVQKATKLSVPHYELKLPDGTLREITGAKDLRDELVDGSIPGGMPCRPIAKTGKGGVVKEAAWGTVASIIGRSGFEGRVLFRPVWAHTITGLWIGAVIGFAAWLLLDVFNCLRTALELSGPQYNSRGHAVSTKLAAFAIVCMYWFLSGALPMLAETLRVNWLKKLAATASARAFQFGIGGLILLGVQGGDPSAVLAGIAPGLSAAFGAMVVGALVFGPPGAVIGTVTGLLRAPGLAVAAQREQESLLLPLLGGILAPVATTAAVIVLWQRYGAALADSVLQGFVR